MAVKSFKPTTSTLRGTKLEDRSDLVKGHGPKKTLYFKKPESWKK